MSQACCVQQMLRCSAARGQPHQINPASFSRICQKKSVIESKSLILFRDAKLFSDTAVFGQVKNTSNTPAIYFQSRVAVCCLWLSWEKSAHKLLCSGLCCVCDAGKAVCVCACACGRACDCMFISRLWCLSLCVLRHICCESAFCLRAAQRPLCPRSLVSPTGLSSPSSSISSSSSVFLGLSASALPSLGELHPPPSPSSPLSLLRAFAPTCKRVSARTRRRSRACMCLCVCGWVACVFACPCLTLLVQLIGFFLQAFYFFFSLIFLSNLQLCSVIGALSVDGPAHVCAALHIHLETVSTALFPLTQ